MFIFADRPIVLARASLRAGVACLLLSVLAGCRDLSVPEPPPPTSANVRVTVIIVKPEAADVRVRAQRTLDERGLQAAGTITEESKPVVNAVLGQYRTVEFNFPSDGRLIEAGTWDFFIRAVSPATGADRWSTKCTTRIRKDGRNTLNATEDLATCTGDFALFGGQSEIGIRGLVATKIGTDKELVVGDKANIQFIAVNSGVNTETFQVTVQAVDPANNPVATWSANVPALTSAEERVIPAMGDPTMIWDTSNLAPGNYIVRAGLTSPVPGDPQPTNDRDSQIVTLKAGDFDRDGVPDDRDNCPTVANPGQENCDAGQPGGTLGDACNIPKIRAFVPNCGIAAGATVTVIGFGFQNIQPSQITIGNTPVQIVLSQSACKLEFTNPQNNATGTLRIQTVPPLEAPLCCTTPSISTFTPAQGKVGTAVTVLGCGFTGVNVFLVSLANNARIAVPLSSTSTPDKIDFVVPPAAMPGQHAIELTGQTFNAVRSTTPFNVLPP